MFKENKFPILEFDDNKVTKLNPTAFVSRSFETNKLIITFFLSFRYARQLLANTTKQENTLFRHCFYRDMAMTIYLIPSSYF